MALTPKRLFLYLCISISLLRPYTLFSRSPLVNKTLFENACELEWVVLYFKDNPRWAVDCSWSSSQSRCFRAKLADRVYVVLAHCHGRGITHHLLACVDKEGGQCVLQYCNWEGQVSCQGQTLIAMSQSRQWCPVMIVKNLFIGTPWGYFSHLWS